MLAKARMEEICLILLTPNWQTQPWYSQVLDMAVQAPLLLPQNPNLLMNPHGEVHPLVANKSIRLVAWKVSGKAWQVKEFQKGLQTLSQVPDDQARFLITNRPGENGLAGEVNNRLIPFSVI